MDQAHHVVAAFGDGGARRDADVLDHGGVHQGGRVQGNHGDAVGGEGRRQLDRHGHLGQLALAVAALGGAGLRQHHVLEVDGVGAARGDVDDARGRRGDEVGPQLVHQHPAGEVVHGELELVAVGGQPGRQVVVEGDAGVVHQQVEPGIVARHRVGELAHRLHRGKIGGDEAGRTLARLRDLVHHRLAAFGVAAVHDHVGAVGGQGQGQFAAQAVGGAGDQGGLAGVGNGRQWRQCLRPGHQQHEDGGQRGKDQGAHGLSPGTVTAA